MASSSPGRAATSTHATCRGRWPGKATTSTSCAASQILLLSRARGARFCLGRLGKEPTALLARRRRRRCNAPPARERSGAARLRHRQTTRRKRESIRVPDGLDVFAEARDQCSWVSRCSCDERHLAERELARRDIESWLVHGVRAQELDAARDTDNLESIGNGLRPKGLAACSCRARGRAHRCRGSSASRKLRSR